VGGRRRPPHPPPPQPPIPNPQSPKRFFILYYVL